jgi:hypothetical protein
MREGDAVVLIQDHGLYRIVDWYRKIVKSGDN